MSRRLAVGLLTAVALSTTSAPASASTNSCRARPRAPCLSTRPARAALDLGPAVPGGLGDAVGLPGGSAVGGGLGNPASGLGGVSGIASGLTTQVILSGVGSWVTGSATFVLHQTAHVIAETTAPRLDSTWFSAAYWRVAAISAVLTLPFLFAASVQALIRSDITLLIRAALGYLPLAMLAVAVAAPLTMLLLSASDELAAAVSSAAGHQGIDFLGQAVGPLGGLGAISGSPFLAFLIALFTVAGALVLWIELLIREASVYVIVLMLPLAFAALVWPARRVWAIRSLELLVALILSKFAIVAVLSLGGSALDHSAKAGLAGVLAGLVLLILAAFAPWATLRLLPLAELASGTAGALRSQSGVAVTALRHADEWASLGERWASTTGQMRRSASEAEPTKPAPQSEPMPRADGSESGESTTTPMPVTGDRTASTVPRADLPPARQAPADQSTADEPPQSLTSSPSSWETDPALDLQASELVASDPEK